MSEALPAAPAASPPSAQPVAAPAAAPARKSTADLIAAATEALKGTPEAATPTAPAEAAKPAMPSTPEAPATAAVLAEQESASELVRLKGELVDGRRTLEADRAKWQTEQAARLQQVEASQRAWQAFEADPAGFITAYQAAGGKRAPHEIARDIFLSSVDAESLPPEQRGEILRERQLRALHREQEQLRAQLAQEQGQRQMAEVHQRLANYRSELAAALPALTETTPLIKELAGKRPDLAVKLMEDVAGRLAVESPQLGKQSAAQLAERIEQSLASELEPFSGYYERKYKASAPAAVAPSGAPAPTPPAPSASISSAITDETRITRRPTTEQERIAAATRALGGN